MVAEGVAAGGCGFALSSESRRISCRVGNEELVVVAGDGRRRSELMVERECEVRDEACRIKGETVCFWNCVRTSELWRSDAGFDVVIVVIDRRVCAGVA